MPLPPSLVAILRAPSAAAVWELRADLLSTGLSPGSRVLDLLAEFYRFLDRFETGGASRDHSERASLMDIGSFGAVVAADLLEAEATPELARRLLAGALTEGLAVLATRQHVKAWRGELASVFRDAAWALYDELWRWAAKRKPELAPTDRVRLINQLLAPLRDERSEPSQNALLVSTLFALLIVEAVVDAGIASSVPR
jgi:hypothetical protein